MIRSFKEFCEPDRNFLYHRAIKRVVGLNKMKRESKLEQLRFYQKKIEEVKDYAMILLDVDGTILSWNKNVEALAGYKKEELLGQNFSIFYLPQDRQAGLPEKLLALAAREGKANHIGQRARKDGTLFWGNITIHALYDQDKEVIGFTKATREITAEEMSQRK
jgi:PAS domain S-box-containing protein